MFLSCFDQSEARTCQEWNVAPLCSGWLELYLAAATLAVSAARFPPETTQTRRVAKVKGRRPPGWEGGTLMEKQPITFDVIFSPT